MEQHTASASPMPRPLPDSIIELARNAVVTWAIVHAPEDVVGTSRLLMDALGIDSRLQVDPYRALTGLTTPVTLPSRKKEDA